MKKERAKRQKEEEGESDEEETEVEKLVHRDKKKKPKEDPKTAHMREERIKELKELTKHEVSLASKSKDKIREMMEQDKAKKGKEKEKSQEDPELLEMAWRLNILTRKVVILDIPKEALKPPTNPLPTPEEEDNAEALALSRLKRSEEVGTSRAKQESGITLMGSFDVLERHIRSMRAIVATKEETKQEARRLLESLYKYKSIA